MFLESDEFNQKKLNKIIHWIDIALAGVDIKIEFCNEINLTRRGKTTYVYFELDI